ncbi:TIGR03773 family transporter-associated surface protein [Kribbella sp. NPDC051620]|uniref:TIGR03773 family transporter-associated surface protein n=1 Tax=Kribbella sp. NPDC051620 TaxID=3364120 RepID=UPI0037B27D5A
MTATHSRSPLPTRLRAGLLAAGAALLALALALGMALLPLRSYAGAAPEVLQAVHTDALHTTYDGSVLRLSTRIGLGEYREADPANLIFNLEDKASARVELPDLPAFAFLGKPGDPVWIAPESQDPDLIWPGWDTETITPGTLAGDAVDLTLLSASGPGNVEIFFNYDDFTGTAQRLFSAADPTLRTLHQPVGRHVHANWSFTAPGTYHLTFQATATATAGTPLASTPTTYTFVVGPYTPPTTPPGTPGTPTTPPGTPTNPTPSNTPTGPGHPTATGPEHPTPTAPGRTTPIPTTPTGPTGPTGPTTPAPTPARPTTPPPALPGTAPTPTPTPTPKPTTPLSSPPRSSSFSGGDGEHSTSDSPPNSNDSNRPGALPPCPTTSSSSNPATNPTTSGNPTTGQTNPPGTTNSPNPTNPSTTSPTTPTNPANPTKTTLDNGHADYAVRLENGALKSRIKDGTKPGAPIWRDPASVTIRLTPASATYAPGGAFNFLGPAGSPLWQIPQTQKNGVIWLGWNTEELTSSQLSTPVDWRLTKVTGPGSIAVFEFDSFGQPKIIFNSRDGLPDTYKIPLGTHAHGNWSFTKPGTYQATFTHSATLTTGTRSTTTSTLTFVVPATPSNASNSTHPAAHTTDASGRPAAAASGAGATGAADVGDAAGAGRASGAEQVMAASAVLAAGSPTRASTAVDAGSPERVVLAGAAPLRGDAVLAGAVPSRAAVEGCRLASAGAEVEPAWIGGGVTLLVIGVVTLVATRRRGEDA